MTDEEALRAAICTERNEDTPRLVYADWLDEHDRHDEAEFIRIGCETATLGEWTCKCIGNERCTGCKKNERTFDLRAREGSLASKMMFAKKIPGEWRWAFITSQDPDNLVPRLIFARGFVDRVVCNAADWLQHANAIYWHLEQTVECERCLGPIARLRGITKTCDHCGDKGCIPRPFPATAQPLRKVTLTTRPKIQSVNSTGNRVIKLAGGKAVLREHTWPTDGSVVSRLLAAEWPGLEFVLPPTEPLNVTMRTGRGMVEFGIDLPSHVEDR